MKRYVWKLILALALVLALAGCTKTPPVTPPVSDSGSGAGPTTPAVTPDPTPEPTPVRDYADLYGGVLSGCRLLFEDYDLDRTPWGGGDNPYALSEMAAAMGEEGLALVGWRLEDLSGDGEPELVIGEIRRDTTIPAPPQIYAVYALDGDDPVLVVDGHARNAFYMGEDGQLLNVGSNGAIYSIFGTYTLSPNGLDLVCQDFYYTHEVDEDFTDVGCYHNTSGEMTGAAGERLDWSLEQFWEKEAAFLDSARDMELSPLEDDRGEGGPAPAESAWLKLGWAEEVIRSYDDWDTVALTEGVDSVEVALTGGHIEDLTLLRLSLTDSGFDTEVVHEYGAVKEDTPVVVSLIFYGDVPSWGVGFTDMEGEYHRMAIGQSGKDGSLLLTEF